MIRQWLGRARSRFRRSKTVEISPSTDTTMVGVLDLSKKQQDEYRRHRRRNYLLRSLPGVAMVIMVSLWFILPAPLTNQAIGHYNDKHYDAARGWLSPLAITSPEPFVIAFNSGTVDTRLGNYAQAQDELERALRIASPDKRCMAAQNLAYSLNAHAASKKGQPDATRYSKQAAAVKNQYKACFQMILSQDKNKDKKQEGGGGGGGGSQSDAKNASQEQKLLEKNTKGQASEQPNINQLIIDLSSPSTKPW